MPICEQEDWRALGKVGRLFAILHADVDCLSKMDFTLGLQKLMAIGGVCALAMGVSGAEFTFAPNVEPKPVTMSVESNTLVRLDLIRNLRDVVHDMELEDHNATGTYLD